MILLVTIIISLHERKSNLAAKIVFKRYAQMLVLSCKKTKTTTGLLVARRPKVMSPHFGEILAFSFWEEEIEALSDQNSTCAQYDSLF